MPTDEDAIRNLIALHAQMTDDGEAKERVNLYTEDGEFDFAGVKSVGRDALAATFAASSDPARRGKHITANMVIEIDDARGVARTPHPPELLFDPAQELQKGRWRQFALDANDGIGEIGLGRFRPHL